jgi:hypothetical protein
MCVDDVAGNGPGGYCHCSPRHGMPFKSRKQNSNSSRRPINQRAIPDSPYDEGQFKFTFRHLFTSSEPVYFAFTFPFGFHENEAMLDAIDARFNPAEGAAAEKAKHAESVAGQV